MTYKELREAIIRAAEKYDKPSCYVGFRFDERKYNVGEKLNFNSKTNMGREDERDFPEYGTKEYNRLEELDGVCAYTLDMSSRWVEDVEQQVDEIFGIDDYVSEDDQYKYAHIYILSSDQYSNDFAEDEYEIILPKPTVLEIII